MCRAAGRLLAIAFVAAVAATGCTPAPSSPVLEVDVAPFLGRYASGAKYVSNRMEVRPDGRFVAWGSSCLEHWGYAGSWRVSSPRCITLEQDPRPPCASDVEDLCCLDPTNCNLPTFQARICLGAHGVLEGTFGTNIVTKYVLVDGHPGEVPAPRDDRSYAYKVASSCTREGNDVSCWCTNRKDVARLEARSLRGTLTLVAAEPLDLRALAGHRLVELDIVDSSLTSLAALPGIPTLRALHVEAPLRALGDMSRFPALERLDLNRTHLRDLHQLSGLQAQALRVSSFQRLDLAPLAALPQLATLIVSAMDISSVETVEQLVHLGTLGLLSAPKWPTPTPTFTLDGVRSASIHTLVLEATTSAELQALVARDIRASIPNLSKLEVRGAGHISNGVASGVGLEEPNDYDPPHGVSLAPAEIEIRVRGGGEACRLFGTNQMSHCAWSEDCIKSGLCSPSSDGSCHAGGDADCEQSVACFDDDRCAMRDGACVARRGAGGGASVPDENTSRRATPP